jgi:hypothetical protein
MDCSFLQCFLCKRYIDSVFLDHCYAVSCKILPLLEVFWSYYRIEFSCFYIIAGQSSQRHYCAITVGEDAVVSAYRWVPLLIGSAISNQGDDSTSSLAFSHAVFPSTASFTVLLSHAILPFVGLSFLHQNYYENLLALQFHRFLVCKTGPD